jgi:hypothetical protein
MGGVALVVVVVTCGFLVVVGLVIVLVGFLVVVTVVVAGLVDVDVDL